MDVIHVPTGEHYATKRFEEIFTKERSNRLLREISILSNVKHPCLNKIASIIPPDDFDNFNEIYIVLEKCDMDLKKLMKSSKHLDEIQVKSMIYDILCGVFYLHKADILHRDLKPANILLNNDCTI